MAEAATLLNSDGMLVLFAGVPNGTMAPLDLSQVYLNNAQYTGTSGLTMEDQALVMQRALEGALSPGRSVAAIGGMESAQEGVEAMMEGRYPGKIVIFPQIQDLPLLGLDELAEHLPDIAAKMDPGNVWNNEAEHALIESLLEWLNRSRRRTPRQTKGNCTAASDPLCFGRWSPGSLLWAFLPTITSAQPTACRRSGARGCHPHACLKLDPGSNAPHLLPPSNPWPRLF